MVSIIMPVYNALPYLEQCIESILDQKLIDWELCAVNDGSTDGSLEVLRTYSEKDQRIRLFDNTDKGIIGALQLGYRRSYGEFITRMDADDIMPAHKLENLLRICVLHDHVIATAKVRYFADEGIKDGYQRYADWINSMADDRDHWKHIYKECVIPSPCWMMRREDFQRIGAFSSDRYPEDYDLAFRMYASGMEVIADKEVLHLWRDHESRASRNDVNYKDNRFLDLKIYHFLALERPQNEPITLWGAGDKGKYIAKELIAGGVDFRWVTENPKKIGVDIYGRILLDGNDAPQWQNDMLYIMAVANLEEQDELSRRLAGREKVFWFC